MVQIIGGGIAGTATALALHKAGFDVTVHEAHPDSGADIGAFLTLADNGAHALAQIDTPVTKGFPLTSMSVLAATGEPIATRPLTDYRCLRRADLAATLRTEADKRNIRINYGKRYVSIADDTVLFDDGSTATDDVTVGADGLNSTVRAHIDDTRPRYAGQHVYYGYTTTARPPTTPGRITMIRGSSTAFGYCVSPDGETFWFARVTAEEGTSETLRDRLADDDTPAADIVDATDDLMVTNAWDLPPGGRWHTDRVLLIGDAAHAASPATGQGASMALEDAIVLAKALRDTPHNAFATYERLRRPRVEANMAASAAASAGRPTDRGPQSRASHVDDELARLISWTSRLTE